MHNIIHTFYKDKIIDLNEKSDLSKTNDNIWFINKNYYFCHHWLVDSKT